MPRCVHCGSPDLAAGLDHYHCNWCGKLTNMATRQAPPEGLHYNDDALDAACREWVTNNHPDVLRLLADTIAGHPDAGTEVGGAPVSETMPTEEPEAPAEEPMEPEAPAEEEPVADPFAPAEPEAVA